jgi:hypothetical protein
VEEKSERSSVRERTRPAASGRRRAENFLLLVFYAKGVPIAEFKADNVVLVQLQEGGAA